MSGQRLTDIMEYQPNPDARIQAMLIDYENTLQAFEWAGDELRWDPPPQAEENYPPTLMVHTLEGWVSVPHGSYLARGTHGEFYPISAEVMARRWVAVNG